MIERYKRENWNVIYPDGSLELHLVVGRVGVYFGDSRDVAQPLPTEEAQTNNKGGLRTALAALRGHVQGTRSVICPDSMCFVDGVLGRAPSATNGKRPRAWLTMLICGPRCLTF